MSIAAHRAHRRRACATLHISGCHGARSRSRALIEESLRRARYDDTRSLPRRDDAYHFAFRFFVGGGAEAETETLVRDVKHFVRTDDNRGWSDQARVSCLNPRAI